MSLFSSKNFDRSMVVTFEPNQSDQIGMTPPPQLEKNFFLAKAPNHQQKSQTFLLAFRKPPF